MSRRLLGAILFAVASTLAVSSDGRDINVALSQSGQLIVVTAPEWSVNQGTLARYERGSDGSWRRVSADVPVMLGRNGLAWGVGLHAQPATKREGDGRAPAGVFDLERTYGREARAPSSFFPYQQLSARMEGIDDSKSRYYNRLVDAAEVRDRDWSRSEKVRPTNPMFRWCIEVKHNWQQRPNLGSCIYMHIWKARGVPTSGCTAMSENALGEIVRWLDVRKRPLLVQMPEAELRAAKILALDSE